MKVMCFFRYPLPIPFHEAQSKKGKIRRAETMRSRSTNLSGLDGEGGTHGAGGDTGWVVFTPSSPRGAPEAIFQWVSGQWAPEEPYPCLIVQLAPFQLLWDAGACTQLNPHGFVVPRCRAQRKVRRRGRGHMGTCPTGV